MAPRQGKQIGTAGRQEALVGRHHMQARGQRLAHVAADFTLAAGHLDQNRHLFGSKERLGSIGHQIRIDVIAAPVSGRISHQDALEH